MTGLEMVIYILKNNLENEEVIKDGQILGFMHAKEAAAKLDIGEASAKALAGFDGIHTYKIGGDIFLARPDAEPWINDILARKARKDNA